MNLCPYCLSDQIERTTSTGLRIVVCLILIFIVPFGFFFCWVPFVFSHKYRCLRCHEETKENDLLLLDWRDREQLLAYSKENHSSILPLIGQWINYNDRLYKLVQKEQWVFLVEVKEQSVRTFALVSSSNDTLTIENIDSFLSLLIYTEDGWQETMFSKGMFTNREMDLIQSQQIDELKKGAVSHYKIMFS
jgi:hypothetical protein